MMALTSLAPLVGLFLLVSSLAGCQAPEGGQDPCTTNCTPGPLDDDDPWASIGTQKVIIASATVEPADAWKVVGDVVDLANFSYDAESSRITHAPADLPSENATVLVWRSTGTDRARDLAVSTGAFFLSSALPAEHRVDERGDVRIAVTPRGVRYSGGFLDDCPRDVTHPDGRVEELRGGGFGDVETTRPGESFTIEFKANNGPCRSAKLTFTWMGIFAR